MSESEFGETKEFIEGVFTRPLTSKSSLVGCKCKSCGKIYFPKKKLCTNCLSWDNMEELALSRRGKIFTWTLSQMYGLPSSSIGYVDIPEGIRLFAKFTECDPPEKVLKIGMEVEMVVQKMTDPFGVREFVGYMFKPVKSRKGGESE